MLSLTLIEPLLVGSTSQYTLYACALSVWVLRCYA